ncbi:hypothetical protein NECAME_02401 [Necator americanus]|uniref:Uncharacterized protein n=1 Tax=Necator americanus TaxID=51031 RepID=W2TFC0_NECAM|nr:hypothetical protein NECAME_02401 [Necator americanus]ETN80269.1 hypothetical protein NECAME_02401 [Necator americanus]
MKIASKLKASQSAFDKDRPHILSNVNRVLALKALAASWISAKISKLEDIRGNCMTVYRNTVICADWECNFERPEHWKPKTSTPLLCVTVD